jgi:hypothetical protein
MRNHKVNQHVTGRSDPDSNLRCDPVAINQLEQAGTQIAVELWLLQPECNVPPDCKLHNRLKSPKEFPDVTVWGTAVAVYGTVDIPTHGHGALPLA